MATLSFNPADLAPGDWKSKTFDTASVAAVRVTSRDDPLFEDAYRRLWDQFGPANEIESREVLGRRLAWDAAPSRAGFAMRYELLAVRSRDDVAAVRDHTAVANVSGAVVHLSHVLVEPPWRRGGIAGWLRALPIQTAVECLRLAGFSASAPITLVAEMEYPDGQDEARWIRLKAYERAGFGKIAPAVLDYHQPDFRAPDAIDASGGPKPLPFQLIVRRVGREHETQVTGSEARDIVERLYSLYAREFRRSDMEAVWGRLARFPAPDARIALVPPTAGK